MRDSFQDQAKQLRVVVIVVKALSGRLDDRQVREHQLREIGIEVSNRLLVPRKVVEPVSYSRSHGQEIFDRNQIEPLTRCAVSGKANAAGRATQGSEGCIGNPID